MRMLLLQFVLATAVFGNAVPVSAQSEFAANLSGTNEVPVVNTAAFGTATFDVNVSGNVLGINYELTAVNVTDAFMGHIHCGLPGANGPVMVWLAGQPSAPPNAGYDLNGAWVKARLTEKAIIPGTPCGNTLVDLVIAMANGNAYVNIHTRANPDGEIRGQIQFVAPVTVP